ncbi:hypothetical protein [Riemerella columbina]|uniref:hypothetical protein n=1 Tax=Riemerella columbina TaxID=103810 RepID=UPI000374763F|nr:hypothetical protein [Riemerella columbina]
MKKVVLCAVLAAGSLALYSFRGVDKVKTFSENQLDSTPVKEFRNFRKSSKTFSDKFTQWREEWVQYHTIAKMEADLDEMNKVLDNF